jgi:NTE family protein
VVLSDGTDAPLQLAVGASCAMPGYFKSVSINGHEFVDGGIHSPTNADTLASQDDLDLVIVISPMSSDRNVPRNVSGALRRLCHRVLQKEVAQLRGAGIRVVVLEPGPAVVTAMGADFMDFRATRATATQAFFDTGRLLAAAHSEHELPFSRRARIA